MKILGLSLFLLCISLASASTSSEETNEVVSKHASLFLYKLKLRDANAVDVLNRLNSEDTVVLLTPTEIDISSYALVQASERSYFEHSLGEEGIEFQDMGLTLIDQVSAAKSVPTFQMSLLAIEKPMSTLPNTVEYIKSQGYPVETHEITTEDNYILTYFRIPHGKGSNAQNVSSSKGPVLLQHGILSSSYGWFLQDGPKNLPFMLAEEGYDVWLGNARGTSYSKKHKYLSFLSLAYWRFCWEDMGRYDIPAAIDHILKTSGAKNLLYVGYSMGTTQFFAMSALRPEYNSKVRLMTAFAPVAYTKNILGPMQILGQIATEAEVTEKGDISTALGSAQASSNALLDIVQHTSFVNCTPTMEASEDDLCNNFLYLLATGGSHNPETNFLNRKQLLLHTDTTSMRAFLHYGQGYLTKRFARFSYGIFNWIKYGRPLPPSFSRKKMKVPMVFYWGENDVLAHPKDVEKFGQEVPHLVGSFKVANPDFNHLDFIAGTDAFDLLYKPALEFMNSY